jgi:hypothetical protein
LSSYVEGRPDFLALMAEKAAVAFQSNDCGANVRYMAVLGRRTQGLEVIGRQSVRCVCVLAAMAMTAAACSGGSSQAGPAAAGAAAAAAGAAGGSLAGAGGAGDAGAPSDGGAPPTTTAGAGGDGAGGDGGEAGNHATDEGPASIDELLTTCPSAAAMAEIDNDLDLVFDNVAIANDAPVCFAANGSRDLSRAKERAYQSLLAMKALKFDAPLPWTDRDLYSWFGGVIDGIIFEETSNFCCGPGPAGTGRYLHVRLGDASAVYATELWVNGVGLGMLNMVDVMVHESRHAETGQHTCPDLASDATADELGAWGTVYSLHQWLAYHADPCFLRPALPLEARFNPQVTDPHGYQLASLKSADQTSKVRFCEVSPPLSDVASKPLPSCSR